MFKALYNHVNNIIEKYLQIYDHILIYIDFAYESNFLFPQGHKCSYDELISTKGGNMKRTKNAAYTRKLKKKRVTFLALTSRLANNHMEIQIHETRKEKPSGKETQIFKSLCGQRYLVKQ